MKGVVASAFFRNALLTCFEIVDFKDNIWTLKGASCQYLSVNTSNDLPHKILKSAIYNPWTSPLKWVNQCLFIEVSEWQSVLLGLLCKPTVITHHLNYRYFDRINISNGVRYFVDTCHRIFFKIYHCICITIRIVSSILNGNWNIAFITSPGRQYNVQLVVAAIKQ